MVYDANCASCHDPDPATNRRNILAGVTTTALSNAYRNIGDMNRFQTSLSATQNLDLAAYIKSRAP